MKKLEFKLGNRERIIKYHSPFRCYIFIFIFFIFLFFSNSYIHATYPHGISLVVFNLDNLG